MHRFRGTTPIGQYFQTTAYRRNLSGLLRGFATFWNVTKDT